MITFCIALLLLVAGYFVYGALVEKVYDIVDDLENYQKMGGENSQNGKNKNLWSECIMDWVTIYKANS